MFSFSSLTQFNTRRIPTCVFEDKYPDQTPVIYWLSQYSSVVDTYTTITVHGDNYVYYTGTGMGTGTYVYISTVGSTAKPLEILGTFYNSTEVGFTWPKTLGVGIYRIVIGVKSTVSGGGGHGGHGMPAVTTILFSNPVTYTVTS